MSETRDVTRPIVDALLQCGIFAMRLNSGKVRVRGGYMHLCPEGTADILVLPRNFVMWIETKTLTGKSREKQIEFADRMRGLGHRYMVARSLDDVLPLINEMRG